MNRFLSALEKVGHVSKTIGKDTFIGVEVLAPVALPLVPVIGPDAGNLVKSLVALHTTKSFGGETMTEPTAQVQLNPLESFAITMILGIIQTSVKNPAHKAALQNQLIGVATDIFEEYGMAVPVPAAVPAAVTGA
jgi:hypothetical protein